MLVKHINNLFHCILQGNAIFDFLIDAITECSRNVMARSLFLRLKSGFKQTKYTIILVDAYLQLLMNKPLLDMI